MEEPQVGSKQTSNLPAAHWSTDYIEHLRTVHFTLIAVCTALIALSTSRSQSEIHLARMQIQQIQELAHNFDESWFAKYVPEAIVKAKGEDRSSRYPRLKLPGDADTLKLHINGENGSRAVDFIVPMELESDNWVLRLRHHEWRYDDGLFHRVPKQVSKAPVTLREFRMLWEISSPDEMELDLPVTLDETAYVRLYPSIFDRATVVYTKSGSPPETQLKLGAYDFDDSYSIKKKYDPTFSPPYITYSGLVLGKPVLNQAQGSSTITIPVTSFDPLMYDGQSMLMSHCGQGCDWRHGKFDDAFSQLSGITQHYEDLNFATIEKILTGEEKRTGESFEALGIKFPAENTTRWGMLIILSIQMYFWLHLHELSPRLDANDPGWDVAWIGVYSSIFSRMVMFASISVLPLGAIIVLGIRGLYLSSFATTYWVMLMCSAIVTLPLGLLAWFRLYRIQERHSNRLRQDENVRP